MIKTIASANAFGEPWVNAHNNQMFPVKITFTDNTVIYTNSTKPSPPYGPGDVVEVAIKGQTRNGEPKGSVKKVDQQGQQSFQQNQGYQQPVQPIHRDKAAVDATAEVSLKFEAFLQAREQIHRKAQVDIQPLTSQQITDFCITCAYGMIQNGWKPGKPAKPAPNPANEMPWSGSGHQDDDEIPF